jgi:hypothetical protein
MKDLNKDASIIFNGGNVNNDGNGNAWNIKNAPSDKKYDIVNIEGNINSKGEGNNFNIGLINLQNNLY